MATATRRGWRRDRASQGSASRRTASRRPTSRVSAPTRQQLFAKTSRLILTPDPIINPYIANSVLTAVYLAHAQARSTIQNLRPAADAAVGYPLSAVVIVIHPYTLL